ncbi:MarR family transcriptional regulator [Ferrovibrio xuzhouensis]|uniref:MarR family transcriptional regulator n=2 Tax=Ferrovibrio xuzhouensis TaxID=1576914 RepID=A0ABV7VCN5_9PROT
MVALLEAIGSGDEHTQRTLATRMGVALGLANALLKRCAAKGLVKIQNAPARRYAYYLTPKGFAEKSRLVAEYLETSLHFFRGARSQYEEAFAALAARGIHRVALVGSGELAEIALLSASSAGVTVVAVIAPERNIASFHGRPIVPDLTAARVLKAEAVAIADSQQPQTVYDSLRRDLPTDRIVTPRLLHVTTTNPAAERENAA